MFCKLSEQFLSYESHETCVLGEMVGICLVHSYGQKTVYLCCSQKYFFSPRPDILLLDGR